MYDVVVVGIGPAGLTAGLYAARRDLKTIAIGETIGGQVSITNLIENYPGFEEGVSGKDLSEKMRKQAEKFDCEVKFAKVVGLDLKGDIKTISLKGGEKYKAKAVILATGSSYRKLGAKGEEEFINKGVSYCAICDGPLFKGKDVAVIGGGDSAITTAIYLDSICSKVYLIHRRDKLRGEEANQEKLFKETKVEMVWSSVLDEILGDKFVQKIKVKNVKTNEIKELAVNGVFVEIGQIPTTQLAKQAGIKVSEKGHVIVNNKQETNILGVYAAGDVTGVLAQITNSVGQGSIAATNAYFYLQKPEYLTPDYLKLSKKK